jgi:hypothetical protein
MRIGQQRVVHLIGDGENEDHMPMVRRGPAAGRSQRGSCRGPPARAPDGAFSTGRARPH